MREITITDIQLNEVQAIIRFSESQMRKFCERCQEAENWDEQLYYNQLIDEREHMLQMAYSILRALGLEYDADTHEITKRKEEA